MDSQLHLCINFHLYNCIAGVDTHGQLPCMRRQRMMLFPFCLK